MEGLNDAEEFTDTITSMKNLGFEQKDIDSLLSITAGVLHLGQVVFVPLDDGECELDRSPQVEEHVKNVARLWNIDYDGLKASMGKKLIATRSERLTSNLSLSGAEDARNSLARTIYGRMFDWLVQRVNESMRADIAKSKQIIGVLDIFGFEIFEVNSFEQLCINFCNEKLQQHFNTHVFKEEEACYKSEGIDYSSITFEDNQDVLDLVEKKPKGLFVLLDDVKRLNGDDDGFLKRANQEHAKHPRYKKRTNKDRDMSMTAFGVHHYAGTVIYETRSFIDKNTDEMLLNLKELMTASKDPFIANVLFKLEKDESAGQGDGSRGKAAKKLSQGAQFKGQLDQLMDTLNATFPHYIRCVKPNGVKKPHIFDSQLCLQQLRYAGVFEAVKIRQQGFPFRWLHKVFYERYRMIGPAKFLELIPQGANFTALAQELLTALTTDIPAMSAAQLGRTMVLYKAEQHLELEKRRDLRMHRASVICEAAWRGCKGRRFFRHILTVRQGLRDAIAARDLNLLLRAVTNAKAESRVTYAELEVATALADRIQRENICLQALEALSKQDAETNHDAYKEQLETAADLELQDRSIVVECNKRFRAVREKIEAKRALARGIEVGSKEDIEWALAKIAELRPDNGSIVPDAEIEKAQRTLEIIAKEQKAQDDIRSAILGGSALGSLANLDTTCIRVDKLERAVASAAGMTITTIVGMNLLSTAQLLLKLRQAMQDSDWASIESAVTAAATARTSNTLAAEAEQEVRLAESLVRDRKLYETLSRGIRTGGAKGSVGNLNISSVTVMDLEAAIKHTEQSQQQVEEARKHEEMKARMDMMEVGPSGRRRSMSAATTFELSPNTFALLHSAKLVVRLRTALVAQDWHAVKKVLTDAEALRIAAPARDEMQLAKDELDNQTVIRELSHSLGRGGATGTVGNVDVSQIDFAALRERVKSVESVGTKTEQAGALLQLARVVADAREAMTKQQWDRLPDLVEVAKTVPKQHVPAGVQKELDLMRHQAENTVIVDALTDALQSERVTGVVGDSSIKKARTTKLLRAIDVVNRLTARTDEARWLYDVGEAVLDMRTCCQSLDWASMRNRIAAVRAMHGTMPVSGPDSPSVSHTGSSSARISRAWSTASVDDAAGFQLNKPLLAELELLEGELDNHEMIHDLSQAITGAQLVGMPGELDVRKLALGEVNLAVDRAERIGTKTAEAEQMLRSARLVRDIRRAALDHDWRRVQQITDELQYEAEALKEGIPLKELKEIQQQQLRTTKRMAVTVQPRLPLRRVLAPAAVDEIERLRTEADFRRVVRDLTAALETGNAGGVIGRLALSECGSDALQDAIDIARTLDSFDSNKTRHLQALARLVWQLREAALSEDFAAVQTLLDTAGDVLGTTVPLPSDCVVPERTLREVALLQGECDDRRIKDAIRTAIITGAPRGQVGRLNLSLVEVKPLEHAIDLALQLTCQTRGARSLAATAALLRSMRLALIASQWDKLGELLNYAHDAGEGAASNTTNPASAGANGTTAKPPASFASTAFDVAVEGVAIEAKEELRVMGDELDNRNIMVHISNALSRGAAVGEIGHLDVTSIDIVSLDQAIAYAKKIGCQTQEASQLLGTAQLIRRLRHALMSSNWQRLEIILTEAQGRVLADIVADEIRMAQDELDNRTIVTDLADAMGQGQPTGSSGKLFTGSIELKQLETALSNANHLGTKSPEARQMLFTAKVVHRLRQALLVGDYNEANITLEAVRGKKLAKVAMREIQTVQDEVDNWLVVNELTTALTTGMAGGEVGELDLGDLDTDVVERALENAEDIGCRTQEAKGLYLAARQVVQLRRAMKRRDFDEIRKVIAATRNVAIADIAQEEFQRAQDELDNKEIILGITKALNNHRAGGSIGELDLSDISTSELDQAIVMATDIGCVTQEAVDLLATAKLVRRLRTVVKAQNWEWVAQVLAEAMTIKERLPECALKEFQLAQDELDNRRILSHVTSALSTGGPRGPVGRLDLRHIDIANVDRVIEYSKELGCKTVEAAQIVATAQTIRDTRQALVDGDLERARQVLEQVKGKILAPVAEEEIQMVKYEVDNWAVVSELNAAIAEGEAVGDVVGRLDITPVVVSNLDIAISLTMKLGCHTTAARQSLLSALTVRRLRGGLLDDDWDTIRQVLAEAEEEVDHIIPAAAPEVSRVRAELEYRDVMNSLAVAIEGRDEAGLLESLKHAEEMGLDSHPSSGVQERLQSAKEIIDQIKRCKAELSAAIRGVNKQEIADALSTASAIGLRSPLVEECEVLRGKVDEATRMVRQALAVVDRDLLLRARERCETIGLRIPELQDVTALLRSDEQSFLRKQLDAAIRARDTERVVGITMRLKSVFFDECEQKARLAPASAAAHRFELHQYPRLKPAHMFSRKYGVADAVAHTSMLQHQREPIHTSLTHIEDPALRRLAVKSFRNVLAFMGDRMLAKPILLAQETLTHALVHGDLRDEFFVQVAKQLTNCPNADALDRGWVLMELALKTFPPSEELENYIEKFLRARHADPCVYALHCTLFRGPAELAPSEDLIEQELAASQVPPPPDRSPSKASAYTASNDNGNSAPAARQPYNRLGGAATSFHSPVQTKSAATRPAAPSGSSLGQSAARAAAKPTPSGVTGAGKAKQSLDFFRNDKAGVAGTARRTGRSSILGNLGR